MISKEEIKKLADLARIEIKETEQEALTKEISQILEYISQIKAVAGKIDKTIGTEEVFNVMREDDQPTAPGTYSQELIAEFPAREGNYLKVKKIL